MGGVFIRIPEPTCAEAEGLVESLALSIKEFGEFAAETAASIADGNIPKAQLVSIEKEGHEAIEQIMAMMKLARLTHEKQYG